MDPLTVPLIADAVAIHLDTFDLSLCVLVSKSWHQAFAPSLWASLHLDHSFDEFMYHVASPEDECDPSGEPLQEPSVLQEKQENNHSPPVKSPSLARFAGVLRRITSAVADSCMKSNKGNTQQHPTADDLGPGKSEGTNGEPRETGSLSSSSQHLSRAFVSGITSNGRHVRHIRATVPGQLPIVVRHTPHLSSLDIVMNSSADWPAFEAITKNPEIRLKSLNIIARTLPSHWWETIAALKHLTDLRLVNQFEPFTIEGLIRSIWRCRQLRKLHLVGGIRAIFIGSSAGESLTPCSEHTLESLMSQIQPITTLTDVELRFKDTGDLQDDFFAPFFKLAPIIKRLYPPQLTRSQGARFADTIQTYCHQIERIDLTSMQQLTDSDIAAIVKACPRDCLRELLLSGSHIGLETMAAIVDCQSSSIEKLSIEHSLDSVPSESIQRVLANCRRLRELNAGNQGWRGHVRLDATDILQSPWVCQQSLETLAVCIVGCSSQALQDAVFGQIAQLTHLKNLDLSEMRNETQSDVDKRGGSLTWTLESGMSKLASLKQMEYFWILGGHFDFGETEREWVHQHWPNLHKSAGVW